MRKRRRNIKPRFYVIVSALVIGCIGLLVSGQALEETAVADEAVVTIADVPEEKSYILDIPLSCEL